MAILFPKPYAQPHTLTVNDLIVELERLQMQGHGKKEVYLLTGDNSPAHKARSLEVSKLLDMDDKPNKDVVWILG